MKASNFCQRSRPKPPGYAAQTVLHFGGVRVVAMLDSCATCSVMPEEIVCAIIDWVIAETNAGRINHKARNYPIVRLEKYKQPATIVGVGKTDKMTTNYGVYFRADFSDQVRRVAIKIIL